MNPEIVAVPERKFDVTKWYTETFKAKLDNIDNSTLYEDMLKMFQNAKQTKTEYGISFLDENGEEMSSIHREIVDKFS